MVFIVTDQDREMMEAFRARRGLRSLAEALRTMIQESGEKHPPPKVITPAEIHAVMAKLRSQQETHDDIVRSMQKPDVPMMTRKSFNPQPKPGKKR